MTTFWLLAAALTTIVMACLLPPLLRRPRDGNAYGEARVALYRTQLRELDVDLRGGILTPDRHAEARDELGRRLLDDTALPDTPAHATRPSPLLAALLLAALPGAAIGLYLHLGNPLALWEPGDDSHAPAIADAGHDLTRARVEAMVNRLAQRLRRQPDDAEGWTMLARSYTALDRPDDAAAAWARAVALVPDAAPLRADYADALATANGGRLAGAPAEQIAKALALDPDDPKSLALSASAAIERGDLKAAIGEWEHLLKVLPPDSQTAGRVAASLASARRGLAGMEAAKASAAQPADTPGR